MQKLIQRLFGKFGDKMSEKKTDENDEGKSFFSTLCKRWIFCISLHFIFVF